MNEKKFVKIAELLTNYNLKFATEEIPDTLKCIKCRLLFKYAGNGSCGCKLCRVCINYLIATENKSCPGPLGSCKESLLSQFVDDYDTNDRISQLIVNCPQTNCKHKCSLANLEEHLLVCSMSVACLFSELGIEVDTLSLEEISGDFQTVKIEHKPRTNQSVDNKEIEMQMQELIIDQMRRIVQENKAIKTDIELIKDELKSIKDKMDKKNDHKPANPKITMTNVSSSGDSPVMPNEVSPVGAAQIPVQLRQPRSPLGREGPVISTADQSQVAKPAGAVLRSKNRMGGAKFVWALSQCMVDAPEQTSYKSDCFQGDRSRSYRYQLESCKNRPAGSLSLRIYLHVVKGNMDRELEWPFRGTVTITVADNTRPQSNMSETRQCQIKRQSDNHFSDSAEFIFPQSELVRNGVDLAGSFEVTCTIVI